MSKNDDRMKDDFINLVRRLLESQNHRHSESQSERKLNEERMILQQVINSRARHSPNQRSASAHQSHAQPMIVGRTAMLC
ncbi:MAG: hypothetical protein ONA90_02485, partial [candidate division KSB1 bacterium]|nr:hypothetical protein [candidate division KSB1 bacterium]